MAEAIQSSDVMYINGSFTNPGPNDTPAEVIVTDDSTLLERSEGYAIHISRFSIDTQSSLFFMKADPAMKVCFELMKAGVGGIWEAQRSLCWSVTENLPTLTAFLHKWNSYRRVNAAIPDPIFPALSIDGAGRFHLEPVFSKTVIKAGRAAGGTAEFMCRVQMTDQMADKLGFETLTQLVHYSTSNLQHVRDCADFLHTVVQEDRPDFFLQQPRYQLALKACAKKLIKYSDDVIYDAAATGDGDGTLNITRITTASGTAHENRIKDGRWCKLYWEETHQNQFRLLSQYFWITHFTDNSHLHQTNHHYMEDTGTHGHPAHGFQIPWIKDAAVPQWQKIPRVYKDELNDLDICMGEDRGGFVVRGVDASNLYVDLQVGTPCRVGDVLEIPCSGALYNVAV
jgi:hypothetical protein